MKIIQVIVIVFALSFVINLHAEQTVQFSSSNTQTTLVELFTSQGCSSCPPAEHWLNTFESSDELWRDVVPIAFHVDYWDQLGWPDVYANQAYSARQYRHRQQQHVRSVYTPGIVVNGKEWRGWTRGNKFPKGNENAGILSFTADNQNVKVSYTRAARDIVLNVTLLGIDIETDIKRGENRNRVLNQEFVALSHRTYPASTGNWKIPLPREASKHAKRYAIAIWVSRANDISPIQATGYWIPAEWIEDSA